MRTLIFQRRPATRNGAIRRGQIEGCGRNGNERGSRKDVKNGRIRLRFPSILEYLAIIERCDMESFVRERYKGRETAERGKEKIVFFSLILSNNLLANILFPKVVSSLRATSPSTNRHDATHTSANQ